jgi:hypothetical protein
VSAAVRAEPAGGTQVPAWAMLTLLAVQAAYIVWRGRAYYFFTDDFVNFFIARDEGLTFHYLAHSVFGQFAPGFRLGQWIFTKTFGLSFWGVRLFDIATLGGSLAILLRIGSLHRVASRIVLVVALFAIVSPIFVMSYQWLASSMHVLPATVCAMAALLVMTRPAQLHWRDRLFGAFFYTIGLMFYAKTLFLVPLFLGARVFLLLDTTAGARWFATILQGAVDVAPMLPVAATYLVIVTVGHYGSDVTHPSLPLLADFIWAGWNDGLLCNAFGLGADVPYRGFIANILFLGVVSLALARNPGTIFIWAGFIAYFVLGTTAIGMGRAVIYGPHIATLARYHADNFVGLLACTVLAFRYSAAAPSPPIDTAPRAAGMRRFALHEGWPGLAYGIAVALVAVHLFAAGAQVGLLWPYDDGRVFNYVSNLRATLARLPPGTEILDTTLPLYILPEIVPTLNTMRVMVKLFPTKTVLTGDPSAGLVIDDQGRVAGMTAPDPIERLPTRSDTVASTSDCFLDKLDLHQPAPRPAPVQNRLQAGGWGAIAAKNGVAATRIDLLLTAVGDEANSGYIIPTHPTARGDVAASFQQPALSQSGFSVYADISAAPAGTYRLSLRLARDSAAWACDLKQSVTIHK